MWGNHKGNLNEEYAGSLCYPWNFLWIDNYFKSIFLKEWRFCLMLFVESWRNCLSFSWWSWSRNKQLSKVFFVHTILSSIIWRLLDKWWDVALKRSLQLDLDSKNPVVHVKKSYNCPNMYCLGTAKHLPSQAMNLQGFLTFANRREGNVISRRGWMMAVTTVKNYLFLLLINKEL